MNLTYRFDGIDIPDEDGGRGYYEVTVQLYENESSNPSGVANVRVFGINENLALSEVKVEAVRRAKEFLQQIAQPSENQLQSENE